MLKVIHYPNKKLSLKSESIFETELEEMRRLADEMKGYIIENCHKGYGTLAAPQVGVLKSMFVIRLSGTKLTAINPQIIRTYGGTTKSWEMCLSVPNVVAKIRRHKKCEVEYYDEEFKKVKKTLSQPLSRIFLHEVDHLNGIIMLDHVENEANDIMKIEEYFRMRNKK